MTSPFSSPADGKIQKLEQIARIGVALSAEKDNARLLEMIIDAARAIANADAGTLYILDSDAKNLRFEVIQNDTLKIRINGSDKSGSNLPPPVPLYLEDQPNMDNVSSYAALTGSPVKIPDVYCAEDFNFSGPKSYDALTGYRTQSMLVIPMTNHDNKVIGVVQLINAKDPATSAVVSFSEEQAGYISSLASQAAVALSNTQYIQQLVTNIDEIRLLQESDRELSHKLRDAYLKTEESNRELQAALKKVQLIRIAATGLILLLFIVLGFFLWNRSLLPERKKVPAMAEQRETAGRIFRVQPGKVTSAIYLTGTLEPLSVVNLTSSLNGKVEDIFFRYGEIVSAGQVLLKLVTSQVEVSVREAKAVYIKALERFNQVEKWEESEEVTRARRSLSKTKLTLDSQKQTMDETERLFKKGLVASSEFEWAKQQYQGQLLDYQNVQDEYKATLAKGTGENKQIIRFEMENARTRLRDLEQQLAASTVKAPMPGVIMLPGSALEARDAPRLEKGSILQEGGIVLSIGDLSGFSVKAKVDEVDITKIKVGQKVNVTGDAFPDVTLHGKIRNISSQGNVAQGTGVPSFELKVIIDEIPPAIKKIIYIGMSANMEVLTYERADALTVPVVAVGTEGDRPFVRRLNKDEKGNQAVEKVGVQTGYTTYDQVEILDGLHAGDEVLVGQ
ncbi:MAG: HlyD family efflux transporter periplasmic adaptor subunit [Deltaproteobacteria bacterium]|nr:HlyD family efflux transporter periplasmic adaptor subunit [Deltaproteobacteria bacterium]